ncbi:MAG: VOC family protein [Dokdonella sp.]
MHIRLTSIMVDDQDRAEKFYTDVLGFTRKTVIPMGVYRWLTVTDADGIVELSLEPNANPAGKAFQDAMFSQKIPVVAFEVDDIDAEAQRLKRMGVVFTTAPMKAGAVTLAIFADTCGNLVQIYQHT